MPSFSRKKLLILGFIFVTLLVIPLTVYLAKQQQEIRTRAEKSTTLSFSPPEDSAKVGDKVKFDVFISPGTNQVSFIKLVIKFDPTKLKATKESFEIDPQLPLTIIQDPEISPNKDELSLVLSNTNDLTRAIEQDTKLGTITFDVTAPSETPTEISFDSEQIQIRSVGGTEGETFKNVFLSGDSASLTILGGEISPTPSPTSSVSLTLTPSPTPSADGATPSENQPPVCQSLDTDVETNGNAPYSITFTANGTDADGAISKVTFNFGEGQVEDVTTGGGIGTSSVSLPKAHTYENGGTFTASALLTDDRDGTSDSASCTVTITISGGATQTSEVTPLPATGPSETIVGIGVLGSILFLIGALLFFAL